MEYDIYYCICSALFLAVTSYYYTRQRKLKNVRSTLYGVLVYIGILSIILDIAAAVIDPVEYNVPIVIKNIVNVAFLSCVQMSGPLFMLYTLVLMGDSEKINKITKIVISVPFVTAELLILISPFCTYGAFFINEMGLYTHGTTHFVLYTVMAFYLLGSTVLVFARRKKLQMKKRIVMYFFIGATVTAMLIQLSMPDKLVNTTANALALTLMYHMLESPSEHIDPTTGVFNKTAFMYIINDLQEQEQKFSVVVFMIQSLYVINRTGGVRMGDAILREVANYIQDEYKSCAVIRLSGGAFCVIDSQIKERLDEEKLVQIHRGTTRRWKVSGREMRLNIYIAGINDAEKMSKADLLNTINNILAEQKQEESSDIILADDEFKKRFEYKRAVEAALKSAIANNRVRVYFQPLHRADGSVGALEALCRIIDPEMGFLSPDVFIRIAEQNGSIFELGNQVIRCVMEFIQEYDVQSWNLDHIGVNLSIAQCMKEGMSDQIKNIVEYYNVRPSLISFEITETEAVTSVPPVKENMQKLIESGFSFMLDDFGTGYANFDYIAALPFSCVKIDKTLLWQAMNDSRQMAMLKGISDVIKRLELESVCEGVETTEQSELLKQLGITLQQGFLYSKALPPDKLYEYAKRLGTCAREE